MHRSRHHIAALLVVLLVLCLSCARQGHAVVAPLPGKGVVDTLEGGATLALPRPTPGVAELALWVRAGARAAQPAQLATLAAFWAEQQTGAKARVLPDATELTLPCDTREQGIARCVDKLASVFALRAPAAADLTRLRERLRATRLRALAGPGVDALDPLGRDGDDAQLDSASLMRFVKQYYVASHAVLLGAGDVRSEELAQAFARVSRTGPATLAAAPALEVHDGLPPPTDHRELSPGPLVAPEGRARRIGRLTAEAVALECSPCSAGRRPDRHGGREPTFPVVGAVGAARDGAVPRAPARGE